MFHSSLGPVPDSLPLVWARALCWCALKTLTGGKTTPAEQSPCCYVLLRCPAGWCRWTSVGRNLRLLGQCFMFLVSIHFFQCKDLWLSAYFQKDLLLLLLILLVDLVCLPPRNFCELLFWELNTLFYSRYHFAFNSALCSDPKCILTCMHTQTHKYTHRNVEENNRMRKTRNLFKKIGDTNFMQGWAQ